MKAKTQLHALIRELPYRGSYTFNTPVKVEHNALFHIEVLEIYRPSKGAAELITQRSTYNIAHITENGCEALVKAIKSL